MFFFILLTAPGISLLPQMHAINPCQVNVLSNYMVDLSVFSMNYMCYLGSFIDQGHLGK